MARVSRGRSDERMRRIAKALAAFEAQHPRARVELYRQSPASVRIRIINPEFAGLDWPERHDLVWSHFASLPDDVICDITMLVLLTPRETKRSPANLGSEHPAPSFP
jgi:stress-induced morphogen